MPPSSSRSPLIIVVLLIFFIGDPNPKPRLVAGSKADFSILNYPDHDFSPPPPPPPPPPVGPAVSCEEGLGGAGSFDTLCELKSNFALSGDVYIEGNGSLSILPNVVLSCLIRGCSVVAQLSGAVQLGSGSAIVAGTVQLAAGNISLSEGATLNTSALGGDSLPRTSGAGTGVHGDGGGDGGRGASCYAKDGDTQEDSWGGDVYAWDSLMKPVSYGSRGGTTSLERDYGGGGGGRVILEVKEVLVVDGMISADGGDGGSMGGGGSGGSIYIIANKM